MITETDRLFNSVAETVMNEVSMREIITKQLCIFLVTSNIMVFIINHVFFLQACVIDFSEIQLLSSKKSSSVTSKASAGDSVLHVVGSIIIILYTVY